MQGKRQLACEVLKILGGIVMSTAEVIDAVLSSPYGASYGQLQKRVRAAGRARETVERASRQQRVFYDLIHRLQKDGLIAKKGSTRGGQWHLTSKGRQELDTIRADSGNILRSSVYAKQPDTEIKIIAFDIPEKYRRKRRWLRAAIQRLGFSMLQKSVWIGKYKLPHEFIEDLHRAKLLPYIEILAVTKSGILKTITRGKNDRSFHV
ncbi:MAG: CRISPR-associated endonuclease Cas2 [Candidatus Liptonbacteria bacterium RIFCSPLOWO2_01_FULL_52_25]|uniref:CRISPR-associated endonuclease Cas2 n=1 Tax=Candidatus Liptonbacteria bacterium RIFCSPLOWO2_01_FULL_52_25 TaxID=1798650 RepID=A0A1G2CDC2_9BACT|nr:MAG: CRISPR-associated endonuclease Cas2 [Candidatus Liptonbacteria bacterium RIFCSPLOWO2_01_FULL_52_25]